MVVSAALGRDARNVTQIVVGLRQLVQRIQLTLSRIRAKIVVEDGYASERPQTIRDISAVCDHVITLDFGPGLLKDGAPNGPSVGAGLRELQSRIIIRQLVVDRHMPRLASDIELNAVDAGRVLCFSQEHIPHELREFSYAAHRLHHVASASAALPRVNVGDGLGRVKYIAARRLLRGPPIKCHLFVVNPVLVIGVARVVIRPEYLLL